MGTRKIVELKTQLLNAEDNLHMLDLFTAWLLDAKLDRDYSAVNVFKNVKVYTNFYNSLVKYFTEEIKRESRNHKAELSNQAVKAAKRKPRVHGAKPRN